MVKSIPNAITLLNLFSGCIGVVAAFNWNLGIVFYCLGISLIADFLDGAIARRLNAISELGKELDSLADLISFGFFPSVLVYQMLLDLSLVYQELAYGAFFITVFTAIRLAKFNIQKDAEQFYGLPSPANAILVIGLVLAADIGLQPFSYLLDQPFVLFGLIVVDCILLIVPVPFFSLKFKDFSWSNNGIRYIFLFFAILLLIWQKFFGLPMIVLLYIILSLGIFFKKAIWS